MKGFNHRYLAAIFLVIAISFLIYYLPAKSISTAEGSEKSPQFEVDPFWPKPLPNNWLLGQVSGVAIDSKDHIWIIQRPKSLDPDEAAAAQEPPAALCCIPAPPVIEFDQEGNLVQAWGGPGEGFDWPETEHGISIDHKDNVWIGGNGPNDHQVLKFRPDGTFLLQIGQAGKTGGNNNIKLLGRPPEFDVDPKTDEVYIADGYLNHRVIVFDADSGEYKRHWGAYGERPDDSPQKPYDPDGPPAKQFGSPTHTVLVSKDDLVYVCDRNNDRVQVFKKDGKFVKEVFIARETRGNGSAWDADFSHDPDQTFLYVTDGTNQCVWILNRKDLKVVDSFGRSGRNAGQFHWVHSIAVDSKGNAYTTEVQHAKRIQKFISKRK